MTCIGSIHEDLLLLGTRCSHYLVEPRQWLYKVDTNISPILQMRKQSPGRLRHSFKAGCFYFGFIDILGQIILCCGGKVCALWDVLQHPWPLPSKCQ